MRTCQRWIGWGCGALLGALAAGVSSAQTNEFWNEFCLESAGVRYGFAANKTSDDFQEAAAFVNWYMPWRTEFGQGWLLRSRLDAAAGWLGDRSVDGFVASLGPSAVLSYGQIPLSLGVGASPTLISRSNYDTKNLGGPFEFTTHIGLNWDFARHFRLGYSWEHISNAGLSQHNPGLNLHMFSISYVF